MSLEYNEEDEYYEEDNINEEDAVYEEDNEILEMKKRVKEMENEQENLNKMQKQVENQISTATDVLDESYVGQVDYETQPEELKAHFSPCGTVNRVTIICDKFTGKSKGYAYIEFVDKSSVENALRLDDTVLKGRNIKVLPKRQNLPSRPPPSVRGSGRGRFGGRGYPGRGRRGGFAGVIRGRGRGRGRFVNRYY